MIFNRWCARHIFTFLFYAEIYGQRYKSEMSNKENVVDRGEKIQYTL